MANTKKNSLGNKDQVISGVVFSSRAAGTRAPDPGFKNIIVWFFQDHQWKQRHARVKLQATSVKHQAPIFRKRQATSVKLQALKLQATSVKL